MIVFMRIAAMVAIVTVVMAADARAQYGETITVARVLVDVRVTDDRGEPIRELKAGDFAVRIGGKDARVESASFVDETGVQSWLDELDAEPSAIPVTPLEGRLFVVFVQTDFARNTARVAGQMHFRRYAEAFIEALRPEDRVAVFSFDSHLKFRLDFTSDKGTVAGAITDAMLIDDPPPPPTVHSPALASRLDREEMKRAASSEAALLLVGNALTPIDGPKTMILLGWGLGERHGGTVSMRREWVPARRALDAARVTVFALDTTIADYHDLEIGLQVAAAETGGFYAKTHVFPQIAIDRLERTLRGRYELELRVPDGLKPGPHELSIRAKKRGASILAPSSVHVK
jgi:VWFA-related protein